MKNDRLYKVEIPEKPLLLGSADKPFFGDPSKYNPEDLLMSALSACHMMSFLHLCRRQGIRVLNYTDKAEGILELNPDGSGQFIQAILRPKVTVAHWPEDLGFGDLHQKASQLCFIKNSINFPVSYESELLLK